MERANTFFVARVLYSSLLFSTAHRRLFLTLQPEENHS